MTRFMKKAAMAAALLALPAGLSAQTDVALVYRLMLDEQAVITRAGGGQEAATLGARLGNRDIIQTTANTRAQIRFSDDGSLVRLNPSSQLVIQAGGDPAASTKTIELDVGEIWARVTRGGGTQLQVATPAGVAAVKGTEFIVRVGQDGTTQVITLEGVVEFFNQAGTTDVTQGNTVVVNGPNAAPQTRDTQDSDLTPVQGLIDDGTGVVDDEIVQVEVTIQDENGQVRTMVIEMPRSQARALLGGGN